MSRKRYTPEQIISMLREAEVALAQGQSVGQACRTLGVSEQSYDRWRKEYGGLRTDQAKRLKDLEKENGRRIWVILDELPTLHQVPSLQPGLAESRQRASLRWRVASAAQGRRQDDMNQALQPQPSAAASDVRGRQQCDGVTARRLVARPGGAARRIVARVPYRDLRRAWRPR